MWEAWFCRRLPVGPDGNITLREIPSVTIIRGQEVPVVLHETIEPSRIVELFGDALGPTPPDGPLPEATYQALLAKADAMGSPLWRQHWERFRAEGRI